MMCVTTVRYNFLINGELAGPITPTRGLRQGDPLSPYLFILCAEGLTYLLSNAENDGRLHGCRVARGAPPITHLFFADDSLIFFKANKREAEVVKECLKRYERASGQAVNLHKSCATFSSNTSNEQREEVCGIIGVDQSADFGKYLGLPSFIGRNRTKIFAFVENKVSNRLNSWNKKFLSKAGKEILIKSVAQALPTYTMSVYLLPRSTCSRLEASMAKFWWQQGRAERGLHWQNWKRLCVQKGKGGMGFKCLHDFNVAMLGK